MSHYPLPPDEQQRLQELSDYRILDSGKEEDFDELAELASQITECPLASITFIDSDRQWFKASTGDLPSEKPRYLSFCTHVILNNDIMVVENAARDERFRDNPDVTGELGIAFYAGVPIYSSRGFKIGTVCVVDHEPKTLSRPQLLSLQLVSKQVTNLLELRMRNLLLAKSNEILLAESERSFGSYFAEAIFPKWIYEMDTLQILQVNDRAIELYGYPKEEFLELRMVDLRDLKEKKHIHQLIKRLNGNSRSMTFETVHRKKDGSSLPVEVTVTNILYKGKRSRLATMTDISERIKLMSEAKRNATLIEEKVNKAVTDARLEERDYIGKELHDNINQILASTKLYLEIAGSNPEMREDMIRMSKINVVDAMTEIRALSRSLVAKNKEDFSLTASVKELAKSYTIINLFQVDCAYEGFIEELPDDIKLTLFRIIQEAINNSSKYSKATEVKISISCNDSVRVSIQDNGQGFDLSCPRNSGIGFRNIENRVGFYNRQMKVNTAPGKGCEVLVEIPVEMGMVG